MSDVMDVQEGQVLEGQVPAQAPVPGEQGQTPPAAPPVFTKEQQAAIDAAITKAADAAASKAAIQAKEAGRRELQSQQNKNAERARRLEAQIKERDAQLSTAAGKLKNYEPDAAKDIELTGLRTREQERGTTEQQEAAIAAQQQFHEKYHETQVNFIKGLGLNPEDERIDWGEDAPDYLVAMQRTLESVGKIQKEKETALQVGYEKRLREVEEKLKGVRIDANSVPLPNAQAAAPGSDADFMRKFGNGELPDNKENRARLAKIRASY